MDSLFQEVRRIPPVTRTLVLSTAGVTLPCLLGAVHPVSVIFALRSIRRGQLWRLYTSYFYVPASGIGVLFDVFMLYRNSVDLETRQFSNRTADYSFSLLVQASLILVIYLFPLFLISRILFFPLSFLARQLLNIPLRGVVFFRPLLAAMTSQWAEANRGATVSLFGFVNMPAAYFPWALLGLDLIQGGVLTMAQTLTGVIAAHTYIYLDQIYPRHHQGRRLLATPAVLVRWLGNGGGVFGGRPARGGRMWGRGQRLGS